MTAWTDYLKYVPSTATNSTSLTSGVNSTSGTTGANSVNAANNNTAASIFTQAANKVSQSGKTNLTDAELEQYLKESMTSADGKNSLMSNIKGSVKNFMTLFKLAMADSIIDEKEMPQITKILADGKVTDEELAEFQQSEEAKKPEEAKPEEASKPWRKAEVVGAYKEVMADLEAGTAQAGKGGDYDRILSDFSDDGVIGNGAASAQFCDDSIQQEITGLSQELLDKGFSAKVGDKTVKYQGTYDEDDSKMTTGSKTSSTETKTKTKSKSKSKTK